ncbi:MAG: hypothetical protein V8R22_07105 [Lachnospiraceae bacterium]
MAEKSPSLATQAYETIKENIMNLTYPPGMVLTEAMLTKELRDEPQPGPYCDPDAAGRRADRF